MGSKTTIEWTEATFNGWTGCTQVSPGCANCYAKTDDERGLHYPRKDRTRPDGTVAPPPRHWGPGAPREPASEKQWTDILAWDRKARKRGTPMRVFCASTADVFESEAPLAQQIRLFRTIGTTPNLRWLLLTKRPERILATIPPSWRAIPPANVVYGTTVENADYVWCVDALREVPAVERFLSIEPLLGPMPPLDLSGIAQVIVGGESGPGARPMHPDWARGVRDQCVAAGVPFFFKQWGQHDAHGKRQRSKHFPGYDLLDGHPWKEFPVPAAPVPVA